MTLPKCLQPGTAQPPIVMCNTPGEQQQEGCVPPSHLPTSPSSPNLFVARHKMLPSHSGLLLPSQSKITPTLGLSAPVSLVSSAVQERTQAHM